MEQGTSFGVVIAYGLIGLFLLVITLVLLRTMLLASLLVLAPARQAWTWLVRGRTDVADDARRRGP